MIMTERRVHLTLDVTFRTTANVTLQEDDTVDEAKMWLFDGGLKQYIKDYDPDLGFSVPDSVEIVRVETLLT